MASDPTDSNGGTLNYGSIVIVQNNSGQEKIVKIVKGQSISIGACTINHEDFIGCQYGETLSFDAVEKCWLRFAASKFSAAGRHDATAQEEMKISGRGEGSHLFADTNTSQSLTSDDILAMKAAGNIHDEDIVTRLIDGSSTFHLKNTFSKEKYIQKKLKKHLKQLKLIAPSVDALAEFYWRSHSRKIGGLRLDYAGVMLNRAALAPNQSILVFDHSMGLLTGMVALRMDGTGTIYNFVGKGFSRKIVEQICNPYNLWQHSVDNRIMDLFVDITLDLNNVMELAESIASKNGGYADRNLPYVTTSEEITKSGTHSVDNDGSNDTTITDEIRRKRNRERRERENYEAQVKIVAELTANKVDSFLLTICPHRLRMCPIEVASLCLSLAQLLLIPSGSFIVFSTLFEPLANLHQQMMSSPRWLDVRFEEYFLRESQVLPQRTHPQMAADLRLFSGYLLSGILVLAS